MTSTQTTKPGVCTAIRIHRIAPNILSSPPPAAAARMCREHPARALLFWDCQTHSALCSRCLMKGRHHRSQEQQQRQETAHHHHQATSHSTTTASFVVGNNDDDQLLRYHDTNTSRLRHDDGDHIVSIEIGVAMAVSAVSSWMATILHANKQGNLLQQHQQEHSKKMEKKHCSSVTNDGGNMLHAAQQVLHLIAAVPEDELTSLHQAVAYKDVQRSLLCVTRSLQRLPTTAHMIAGNNDDATLCLSGADTWEDVTSTDVSSRSGAPSLATRPLPRTPKQNEPMITSTSSSCGSSRSGIGGGCSDAIRATSGSSASSTGTEAMGNDEDEEQLSFAKSPEADLETTIADTTRNSATDYNSTLHNDVTSLDAEPEASADFERSTAEERTAGNNLINDILRSDESTPPYPTQTGRTKRDDRRPTRAAITQKAQQQQQQQQQQQCARIDNTTSTSAHKTSSRRQQPQKQQKRIGLEPQVAETDDELLDRILRERQKATECTVTAPHAATLRAADGAAQSNDRKPAAAPDRISSTMQLERAFPAAAIASSALLVGLETDMKKGGGAVVVMVTGLRSNQRLTQPQRAASSFVLLPHRQQSVNTEVDGTAAALVSNALTTTPEHQNGDLMTTMLNYCDRQHQQKQKQVLRVCEEERERVSAEGCIDNSCAPQEARMSRSEDQKEEEMSHHVVAYHCRRAVRWLAATTRATSPRSNVILLWRALSTTWLTASRWVNILSLREALPLQRTNRAAAQKEMFS